MHTRVCVPRNVHTHTYGQLIATYVGAVITVGKEELTEPRYIVRVPEFRPCAHAHVKESKKKKKKNKKNNEGEKGGEEERNTRIWASRSSLVQLQVPLEIGRRGEEFSKGDPARASDAPRCHRYLLKLSYPFIHAADKCL